MSYINIESGAAWEKLNAAHEKVTLQINDLRKAYTPRVCKPRKFLFWTYTPEIDKGDYTFMLSCIKINAILDKRIRINTLMKMCDNAESINLDAKDFKLIQQ